MLYIIDNFHSGLDSFYRKTFLSSAKDNVQIACLELTFPYKSICGIVFEVVKRRKLPPLCKGD